MLPVRLTAFIFNAYDLLLTLLGRPGMVLFSLLTDFYKRRNKKGQICHDAQIC
jgi:hypothetical protein